MYEDFINAIQNFRHSKLRTFLSLLGIIIGVGSVIVITTVGSSASQNILSQFSSAGLDLVTVSPGGMRRATKTLVLNESFREETYATVPHIAEIFYKNSVSGTLQNGNIEVNLSVSAIEYGFFGVNGVELDYGENFSVSDFVHGSQKIILGSEVAESLFPEGNAIGQEIIFNSNKILFGFTVIGVLKTLDSATESPNTTAYVPRNFYTKKINPTGEAANMVIRAVNKDFVTQISDDMKTMVTEKTGSEYYASIFSMTTMLEYFEETNATLNLMLSGVAAISLLVGGIGIMNIMIVTVTERKKEIGIRKALGASPATIRTQFLVESTTITLFGGFLGIILGLVISIIVDYVLSWPFSIEWGAVVLSFVFSVIIGITFGLSPAARAAKLNPVDALAAE